jgi:hypothetical protein
MDMKKISLEGYGDINLIGVEFKDAEGETVDSQSNVLTHSIEGRGRSIYRKADGTEVANKDVCKKFVIEGEPQIISKVKPTTKIEKEDIQELEDKNNGIMQRAVDRKIFRIHTDSPKIKELVGSGKALVFPVALGSGYKVWKGVVNMWETANGRKVPALFCCRGDIDRAFEEFSDDTIEIEIPVSDNSQQVKKLFGIMK